VGSSGVSASAGRTNSSFDESPKAAAAATVPRTLRRDMTNIAITPWLARQAIASAAEQEPQSPPFIPGAAPIRHNLLKARRNFCPPPPFACSLEKNAVRRE
jgi:hypothetical protein